MDHLNTSRRHSCRLPLPTVPRRRWWLPAAVSRGLLTAEELVQLLWQAGVPRSIRSITEYCARGDPDERRWYVTPAGVQELIEHFQE
jgi:hypothetical protein